jgi:arginine deiminase
MRTIATPGTGVGSDVDRLGTVLLHRPGGELGAVPDGEPRRALFAAAPDAEAARRDHEVLAALLRERDVEVLHLDALLAELLDDPAARDAALAVALGGLPAGARARVAALPTPVVVRALLEGAPADGLALGALPNLMYLRDPAVWVGGTVAPGTMREPSRRREGPLLEAVFRGHPRFAGAVVRPRSRFPVEGGDVVPAGDGRVLVGISERTDRGGALQLATWLLSTPEAAVEEVVTVRMPNGAGFHLDLVLSLIDHDTFAIWAPVHARLRAHRWRRDGEGRVESRALDDAFAGARVIAVDGDDAAAHRRAWDHGTNLLALAPGVVVAYDDNVRANAALRRAGVEVLEVPGAHLAAGRGGPRCLSLPVARG